MGQRPLQIPKINIHPTTGTEIRHRIDAAKIQHWEAEFKREEKNTVQGAVMIMQKDRCTDKTISMSDMDISYCRKGKELFCSICTSLGYRLGKPILSIF